MSKIKNFLMEVEEEFYDIAEEDCYDDALNHIERKFGTMAREHCESLIKENPYLGNEPSKVVNCMMKENLRHDES